MRRTGPKQLLFDVTRDPGERDELAARHPDRVRRLKAMLDAWEKDVGGRGAGWPVTTIVRGQLPVTSFRSEKNPRLRVELIPQFTGTLW